MKWWKLKNGSKNEMSNQQPVFLPVICRKSLPTNNLWAVRNLQNLKNILKNYICRPSCSESFLILNERGLCHNIYGLSWGPDAFLGRSTEPQKIENSHLIRPLHHPESRVRYNPPLPNPNPVSIYALESIR